ncbi:MAG: SRPBCC family protein [Rickettsiales bacterium]
MNKEFVYTTYIRTTPEKVWQAITTPEFARQYWSNENISDWKEGSEWKHVDPQSKQIRIVGKVLESSPPTRLVTSWASPNNLADESHVTYDISVVGDLVRLDVVHTNLSESMGSGVSKGWPLVLSSLKSFLETGTPIDIIAVKGPCKDAA